MQWETGKNQMLSWLCSLLQHTCTYFSSRCMLTTLLMYMYIYKMYVPLSALVHSCLGDHDTPSKVRRWRGGIIWKSSRLPFSAVEPHKIRGRRNGELLDHPLVHPTLILLHMRAHTEIHSFFNER